MIVGLTGSICSGKEAMADYLVEKYGFKKINILELFKKHIAEKGIPKDEEEDVKLMHKLGKRTESGIAPHEMAKKTPQKKKEDDVPALAIKRSHSMMDGSE